MKDTLEIVRKAMKLKGSKKKDSYMSGQIQVLDHFLNENKPEEELEEGLMNVYSSALGFCSNWKSKKEMAEQELEMCGAADVIAWVLNIPDKDHELNKTMGKVQPK
jgi:hypothetical protein